MPTREAILNEMIIERTPKTNDPRLKFLVTVSMKSGLVYINDQPLGNDEVAWAALTEHFGMQLAQFAVQCRKERKQRQEDAGWADMG